MKLFSCSRCGQVLHFENTVCERCGAPLGFRSDRLSLVALQSDGALLADLTEPAPEAPRFVACANQAYQACNWLVDAGSGQSLCRACQLNLIVPDLSDPGDRERWVTIEEAKHRLVYGLLRLGLPVEPRTEATAGPGLGFRFLADRPDGSGMGYGARPGDGHVITGHDHGIITINIAEADPVAREAARQSMGEAYRTMLGHFRHEIGHYYWDRLIAPNADRLRRYRAIFGDERMDYGDSLQRHYDYGPPAGWQATFISAYASSHPWEDWAETWSHYLHIVDTLDTARAFGLSAAASVGTDDLATRARRVDAYAGDTFEEILSAWVPLTVLMNSLNRSMGHPDAYPFVLSEATIAKLGFVHETIHGTTDGQYASAA